MAVSIKFNLRLQRPRKTGARFTGEKIAPDEFIPETPVYDFEGKRDIWTGFDPKEHQHRLFEEYGKLEEVGFSFAVVVVRLWCISLGSVFIDILQ